MTSSQNNIKPEIKKENILVKNLRPTLFVGVVKSYKDRIESGGSKASAIGLASAKTLKNMPLWITRTTSALLVYSGLNYLYGARSWNTKGDLSAERMINDAGPVARIVATKVSSVVALSAMQPERMTTVANTLLAVEFGICVIRMVAEQIAWRKTKFSGEVAGTGATPLLAFLGEAAVKAIEKKPADPIKKFTIATIGLWGNGVRIVHSVLIATFGNKIWDGITKKKDVPPQ